MDTEEYKHYTDSNKRSIKGESFFKVLVVDHVIPHKIDRENDLGVDFICEWITEDRPRGILFSAQVKSRSSSTATAKPVGNADGPNLLQEYEIAGTEEIEDRTIRYWKGLGLPAYVFYIIERANQSQFDCYYKRYTPMIDEETNDKDPLHGKQFFKVNEGNRFLAYADDEGNKGFARDLIVDYARISYSKGHVLMLSPKEFGFWPFSKGKNSERPRPFRAIVNFHRAKIQEVHDWTAEVLKSIPPDPPESRPTS